jgi:hypothetical protein
MPGGMVPRPDQLMGGLPLDVEKLGGEFERHKRDSNLPNWSPTDLLRNEGKSCIKPLGRLRFSAMAGYRMPVRLPA